MPNRLAASTSPYLLQHADNPVDWWEWTPEAFAQARERDVPVLLSVGYSACHWCHVMAHESFEDADTAAVMNEFFVCIKVDREERPDVDSVYMEATQAMTGHGGWPTTVFLTPDAAPIYCGTYFPPQPRHGMPSFGMVLESIAAAWRERRSEVVEAGQRIVEHLITPRSYGEAAVVSAELLDAGVATLRQSYDRAAGGFDRAPKFPPSMVLEFLLRHHARTGDPDALTMVEHTCERMARGGMYDQLGGGFARYSVDGEWVVPHFEKMLYDNALLLRVYLHLWRETGSTFSRRIAVETADFVVRDLGTPEGGFAAALDADTDGVEGLTYAWTEKQLIDVLGAEDGTWAAALLEVTAEGTFEDGASVLQLRADPGDGDRWAPVRAQLLAARHQRPQPARDDKVVAAWNGLAIAALAEAGALLDAPFYVDAAVAAADHVLRLHMVDGRLRRTSRAGDVGGHAGVLEDYADLAEGLLVLHQVTGQGRWLESAADLLETVSARFGRDDGGFFDTADDAETLLRRPYDPADGPAPSGLAAISGAFLTYAALTGSTRHRDVAESALSTVAALIARAPRAAGWAAAAGEAMLAGPLEIAVAGAAGPRRDALAEAARRSTAPGAVVVVGPPDAEGVPLLAGRVEVDGVPAAYICRNFVCQVPITEPAALAEPLRLRVHVPPGPDGGGSDASVDA
ncbi:MAG: thioredoxin domain-containing protein [Geodermatophilaceae bacterium]|nr:thioredoxin domain-containing protein [Geodermatophilaceae bacterium]